MIENENHKRVKSAISRNDHIRGARLRQYRENIRLDGHKITRREMVIILRSHGYSKAYESLYRNWELGYNIPGEALAAFVRMGLNLNWLMAGIGNPKLRS